MQKIIPKTGNCKENKYGTNLGSRLHEAVELAGGFGKEADKTYHNLARFLVDGERIYIPSKAETEEFALAEKIIPRLLYRNMFLYFFKHRCPNP